MASVPVGGEIELEDGPTAPAISSRATTADVSAIHRAAVRGLVWTVVGFGASQALRLGGNLILTRLLVPELFGLMALVNSFLAGLNMFSDIGTSTSIVRNKRGDDPSFLNTAWTLQAIRGLFLWLGSIVIAYPVARLYGDPRLQYLLPLVGSTSLFAGFMSTDVALLNRHLAVARLARFELSTQGLALALMVGIVAVHPTLWALAWASVLGALIRTACSHCLFEGPGNRFALERGAIDEMIHFGKWLFLSTAALFLGDQIDRLILGKLLSLKELGVYAVAAILADVPRQVSMALNNKVVFPAIAKLSHLPREELRAQILRYRRPVLLASAVGLALFVGLGDLIIRALYDPRYRDAAWMLPLLALSIWPRVLCNTSESALFALGVPQYSTVANTSRFIATAIGIPLGFAWLGLRGAVLALAVNDLPYYALANLGLGRHGLSMSRQDLRATCVLLASLFAVVATRAALQYGTCFDLLRTSNG